MNNISPILFPTAKLLNTFYIGDKLTMAPSEKIIDYLRSEKVQRFLKSDDFESLYHDLNLEFYLSRSPVGEITELLLGADVHPLAYMDYIPENYLYESQSVFDFKIPNHIRWIGDRAFERSSLNKIMIPDSVQYIKMCAFSNTNLEKIEIPGSIEKIEGFVFEECFNLTDVIIEEGVKVLESSAFYKCTNLKYLQLPQSITELYYSAFSGCSELKSISYNGTVEQYEEIGTNRHGLDFPLKIICTDGELTTEDW